MVAIMASKGTAFKFQSYIITWNVVQIFLALGDGAKWCWIRGFNKSLARASSVEANDLLKPWSWCRLVSNPRAQKSAQHFSYYCMTHLLLSYFRLEMQNFHFPRFLFIFFKTHFQIVIYEGEEKTFLFFNHYLLLHFVLKWHRVQVSVPRPQRICSLPVF